MVKQGVADSGGAGALGAGGRVCSGHRVGHGGGQGLVGRLRFPARSYASSTRVGATHGGRHRRRRRLCSGLARPGAYRLEASLDGFETAVRRVALDAGQSLAVELTLAPAGFTEGVVVTARRSEEVAQEVPIPLSVVSGRLMNEAGAFNVNRLKELIPDRPVLLDQPAQLRHQHPRPGRAVRSHQRRHRAGRRSLHRRRVLRAAGVGDASTSWTSSASRCCADRRARSSARTRRPAPSTSPRASRPSAPRATSSSTTATSASCRPRRRCRGRSSARRSPAGCRSRARSATAPWPTSRPARR